MWDDYKPMMGNLQAVCAYHKSNLCTIVEQLIFSLKLLILDRH